MAFEYDIVALVAEGRCYRQKKINAESFREAFYHFIDSEKKLLDSSIEIFCRKKSGDLQYMGSYDGKACVSRSGVSVRYVLRTADGKTYFLSDDGFRTFVF